MKARGPLRAVGVVALAALVVGAMAAPAGAERQQGVAIDLGRIEVDEPLEPGSRYALPTLRVRNPGTAATSYLMTVQPLADSAAPAQAWLAFSPERFGLDPGDRQPVEVVLEIPGDAAAGEYEALLAAQVAPEGDGARVGAAAAARLSFTVASAAAPPIAARPWGLWLLLLALLAILAALRFARRYELRIQRRP